MLKLIKLIIFAYMIYASILVSLGYARNYEKGQQIISNIVAMIVKIRNVLILSLIQN